MILFYRSMTDSQLQAAFKQIDMNIDSDPSEGMIKEMELLRNVAKERGIELGNPFDAVKGFWNSNRKTLKKNNGKKGSGFRPYPLKRGSETRPFEHFCVPTVLLGFA